MSKKYDIAAYVWPSYTGDELRTRIFWPDGIGEWQTVKNFSVKTNDYEWNRKPLWGYVNEADPFVMEMQIEAAVSHGVNVFIYDWYWFDNRPFLENCLNDGFLKARNTNKMKFYLMWANHNAAVIWDKRNWKVNDYVWTGKVTSEQFKDIGRRWINKYFKLENYYKIDNKPVISIYDTQNFVDSFTNIDEAKKALDWLREEAIKEGLEGVHIQFIKYGDFTISATGVDSEIKGLQSDIFKILGVDSVTNYQYVHFCDMNEDYAKLLPKAEKMWEETVKEGFEFYPHVSIGWDNNPRLTELISQVVKNNPPEEFEKHLRSAKKFADENNKTPLITINSWNEWTETSYLEPDSLYGYGYLEAVKKVFCDE